MNDTKVSIIIPVYNPGELLIKCLDSVEKQTLKEIECICIDDESGDDSLKILNEYAQKDKRFKVLTQKHSGAGIARNKGLNTAEGEYIIFLDSDDWIEEDMCESLYNRAQELDVDLLLFDSTRHLENNNTRDLIHFDKNNFSDDSVFDYHQIKDKIMNGPYGVIWCKFYKREFIKNNEIDFPKHIMYNDVEFHIKCMILAKKIAYYPKIFYHYNRIGQTSLQNTLVSSSKAMVFYDVMIGIEEFLNEFNYMEEFKTEFLNFGFYEFKNKLNSIDPEHKEEYFITIKKFFKSMNLEFDDFKELDEDYFIYYANLMSSKTYEEFELMNRYITNDNTPPNQEEYLKRQEFIKNMNTMVDCEVANYKNEIEMLQKDYEMLREVNHRTFKYLLKKMDHTSISIEQESIDFKNEEINRLNNEINRLNDILNDQENKIKEYEIQNNEINNLKNELNKQKNMIKDLNNEHDKTKDENLFINHKNNDLNNLILKKDEKIAELSNENKNLNEKLNSLKNELKIKEHTINSLNQDNS